MKICIIGGGMQGLVIAENLRSRPEQPEVLIADIQRPTVAVAGVGFELLDVLDESQVLSAADSVDVFVLAVPSSIAHDALANLIKTGKPVADVSFTPDPPLDLNRAAVESGSCCVVDCGIAPGLSHVLVGSAYAELGGLDSIRILVGGVPKEPPPTFHHAVYFNPHDLLAEYVRPARSRHKGEEQAPAPLDVPCLAHRDEQLGAMEAFLSDGLRSLLTSYRDVPEMSEWTLRWPGHLQCMSDLRDLGFLGNRVVAQSMAEALATRYPAESYPDYLLMLVEAVKGIERRAWRVLDSRRDEVSAMSRTTGFTTAATAMLLARRQFSEPGVHPPEVLGGKKGLVQLLLQDLAERGVVVTQLHEYAHKN